MATYLDGYQHDVFVSFAAFDDRAPGDAEGWARRFKGRLAGVLWQQLGRRADVAGRGADDAVAVGRSAVLDEIATAERDAASLELVRTGRHRFAEEVLAKKTVLEETRRRTVVADGPRTAFVDLHQSDLPQAAELLACLARNAVAPIAVPVLGLSPSEGLERFEENLERTQLFVLVFGAVARGWVEERLEAAIKLVASRHLSTRMAVCVPSKERRSEVPFRNFVDVMVATDPASIERILKKLDEDDE